VDAQRNRERILEVAREAFTEHGPQATMDDIARRAEIGPGTLYRHFSTRSALIEAVYHSEVEKLTAAGERYATTLQPLAALRAWMLKFIDYVARKVLIMPAMDTVPGGSLRLMEGSRAPIHLVFRGLVERAIASGELSPTTNPDDIVRAFLGVFQTISHPGWEPSARRIVDILLEGSRPKK
jgi:AcrR family transcriptional regulator